ncbi:hypothetical protein D2E28_23690 [Mycobacteroides abscessus]|uniref:hypothetical protein n=1 Tax=Mycobacteroides abscessus TaxID=36809 RepID=UPI000E697973|nr:hypothetical protein [Mycobacteroides abscessus]RIR19303.1 hypothetical protein D2E28_23690 [Mycobacteroides abscessus]
MSGAFEYHPEALAGQVALQNQTAGTFEDIKARAQQKLAGIREFFDSQGAGAYEAASQIIHDGIEELKSAIHHQASTTDNSHQESVGTDMATANSIQAI